MKSIFGYTRHQPYGLLQAIQHPYEQVYVRTRTTAWPAKCKVCTKRQAQWHTHTASLSLVIQYTRRNAHTGDETFRKSVVVDSLALKYRHILKNGQQKKVSAKRPSKNG